jgi:hypothetical protein
VFGFWSLSILKIETVEENKGNEWVLSNAPLPRIDILSSYLYDLVCLLSVYFFSRHNLHAKLILNSMYIMLNNCIILQDRKGVAVDFSHEIEKLPVTNFSILEVYISPRGHSYGAFLSSLFGMHHIQTGTQYLKVILHESEVNIHDCSSFFTYIYDSCKKYHVFFSCSRCQKH